MSASTLSYLFLLFAVHCTQAEQHVVYVDSEYGSLEQSCWTGGENRPCKSLEFALNGTGSNVTIVKVTNRLSTCFTGNVIQPSCPTWMRYNASSKCCECGDSIDGTIDCHKVGSEYEVSVLACNIMTYDTDSGKELVGKSIFGCSYSTKLIKFFKQLPSRKSELNKVCKQFNRVGQLCSDCDEGYAISAYSYDLVCTNCTYTPINWLKYLSAVYIPLTAFFVLILTCRISATSPQLHGFITFSQAVGSGVLIRPISLNIRSHPVVSRGSQFFFTLYGIWNLDFFRPVLPSICLNTSVLLLLALDYAIAFYPLVLIILSYFLIQLHDRDFQPVVYMWKPFRKLCFSRLKKPLNLSSSLVNAYSTFFLLSYVKIINTSFDLLIPTKVYNISGQSTGLFLYYATSVQYFGKDHLPYGVFASIVFALFVLFPLLVILLYPMRCFQKLLNLIHLRTHVLHIFMDSIQGYYKNGTETGTVDCRYFSATYLIVRLLLFVIYSLTLDVYFFFVGSFVVISTATLWVVARPYKREFSDYNYVDAAMVSLLGLYYIAIIAIQLAGNEHYAFLVILFIVLTLVLLVPLVYISVITISYLFKNTFMGIYIATKLKQFIRSSEEISEDSLPDRLNNSAQYENGELEATSEYGMWSDSSVSVSLTVDTVYGSIA